MYRFRTLLQKQTVKWLRYVCKLTSGRRVPKVEATILITHRQPDRTIIEKSEGQSFFPLRRVHSEHDALAIFGFYQAVPKPLVSLIVVNRHAG